MIPYKDNCLERHESPSKGVWLGDPMICAMGPIGNLDGPDVGSTPCSFNCVGGLMMHGTCRVGVGLLGRVDIVISPNPVFCFAACSGGDAVQHDTSDN